MSRIKVFVFATLLLTGLFMAAAQKAQAQQTYLGVWGESREGEALYRYNSWDEFTGKWQELAAKNLRLIDIEAQRIGNTTQYTGVWRAGRDDYALYQAGTWDNFVTAYQKFATKNLRLIDLEVFQAGSEIAYVGVWRAGKDAHALHQLHSWEAFVAKWKELAAKNLQLVDLEAIPVGNETHFTGVWRAGQSGALYYLKSYAELTAKWKELAAKQQRLVDVEVVRVGFAQHYLGVWQSGQEGYALYQTESWEEFVKKWKEYNAGNLRLVDLAIGEKPGKPIPPPEEPQGKPLGLVFTGQATRKDAVSGLDFPVDMPPIHYPDFVGCNADDKKKVLEAWAYAHFCVWRATQVINYIASHKDKDDLWRWGYVESQKDANWSPRAWFGSFHDSRFSFQFIHEAINKVWNDRFLGKKYSFKIKCREKENDGAHPCYLKDKDGDYQYAGNHIVLGTINFCPLFFEDREQPIRYRAKILIHEIFHWLSAKGLYVSDTHTHWDKDNGICKVKTEKMYGASDALHLGSSEGCWGNSTLHRESAARNNDNYAYFIQRLGSAIWDDKLKVFPSAEYFKNH
jgi:hypothetical protein